MEGKLGVTMNVSPDAQYMGALGAALFALDHVLAEHRQAAKIKSEPAVWMDE